MARPTFEVNLACRRETFLHEFHKLPRIYSKPVTQDARTKARGHKGHKATKTKPDFNGEPRQTREYLFGVHPSGCEFASKHAEACTPNAKAQRLTAPLRPVICEF